jgi:methionine-rich copper-binding protein CopC
MRDVIFTSPPITLKPPMSNSRFSAPAATIRGSGLIALATMLTLGAAPAAPAPARSPNMHAPANARRHLHLERSEPAANDTVATAPGAVRLWFSEQPELAVTTIRVSATSGSAIALAPLTRDTGATAPVVAPLRAHPGPGAYTVWWRSTARDGHVSTGQFKFVIAASGSKAGAARGQ